MCVVSGWIWDISGMGFQWAVLGCSSGAVRLSWLVEHNYSSVAQLPEVSGSRSCRSAGKYAAGTAAMGAKSAIKYLYSLQYIPRRYVCVRHAQHTYTYIYLCHCKQQKLVAQNQRARCEFKVFRVCLNFVAN